MPRPHPKANREKIRAYFLALPWGGQRDLAHKTGLSEFTISAYANAERSPTPESITKLAKALGVPESAFLDD